MRFWAARFLLAGLAAAALGAAPVVCADELSEASKLLRVGQHAQALARVDAVLAATPGNPRARFLQGLIFAEQGNTDAAVEVFQKLTQDYPELPEPHNNLAVIYASRGEYEKARASLELSIRTHPSYATAYENLGDVYAKLASQAYDRALKLDSSNAAAQNKLALVRDLVGDNTPLTRVSATPTPAAPVAPVAPKRESKPAAPAPVVAAAPPAAAPTQAALKEDASAAILKAVDAWADAWSRQDVDAYLHAYGKDFKVPGDATREAWEKQRRARLTAPRRISVQLEATKVARVDGDSARVTFRQHYQSDLFKATSTKTLRLDREADGTWRIVEERVGG